jgi:hypothetical protein
MNDSEELSTFRARQERQKAKGINGNGMGMPLAMAVKAWPTPTTRDHKGGGTALVRSDGKIRNDMLDWVAESWATPRSSDGEKGGPNQSFGAGGMPLPSQAVQWPTPATTDSNGARNRTSGRQDGSKHHDGVTLNDAIILYSLPGPETPKPGGPFLPERRSLNPLFVEWLMGWPPGWTNLASCELLREQPPTPESTNSGCSATALFRWRQQMRSALLSLGSPLEALPEQLSLLG